MSTALALAVATLAACSGAPDDCISGACAAPPIIPSRELDLLFVIDNTATSGLLQPNLTRAFPALTRRLTERFSTLPNMHIGVVSGNLGAGGFTISACLGDGDGAVLQNTARTSSCTAQSERWIEDIELAGERMRNYPSSTIEEAFSCIALLGTNGCGFQQHLAALQRALDGSVPENAGFVRPSAHLAIVIVADDDDCSALDPAVFNPALEAKPFLGPRSIWRCWHFGWLCDGTPPQIPASTRLAFQTPPHSISSIRARRFVSWPASRSTHAR